MENQVSIIEDEVLIKNFISLQTSPLHPPPPSSQAQREADMESNNVEARGSPKIKSRLATYLILQNQLLPIAQTPKSQPLSQSLAITNMKKFTEYWDELLGTADGSGAPFLEAKVYSCNASQLQEGDLPFVPKTVEDSKNDYNINDDCSDILVVSDSMVIAAHNEDANVALVGHTEERAALLPKGSKSDFLSLLGNNKDAKYPIYMTGPLPYTLLCTSVIDLDEQTISIIEGIPKETEATFVFSMSSQ
ncbi:unnamed protein product [Fraxinus pennsylvanica]|uniref:Uncharacterized protein n=1 Tax=Fraxinus pennsylvanica TaxID=56036 RepID=A0AAD1YS58_9LAMI|nr:unnamed protein product [Fraxinus pennsylvanica]